MRKSELSLNEIGIWILFVCRKDWLRFLMFEMIGTEVFVDVACDDGQNVLMSPNLFYSIMFIMFSVLFSCVFYCVKNIDVSMFAH